MAKSVSFLIGTNNARLSSLKADIDKRISKLDSSNFIKRTQHVMNLL